MTIRDIKNLISLIDKRLILGLPIDQSINTEFENNLKNKNFIFSSGIDLIYEFFNIEENLNSSFLRKSIQNFGKNTFVNKIFTKIADRGMFFRLLYSVVIIDIISISTIFLQSFFSNISSLFLLISVFPQEKKVMPWLRHL